MTSSATGEDTTGVYGFANVFLRALQEWNPAYCAIAFDTPAPTFRHLQFEKYKAQRPPTPPELRPQFDRVKQFMAAFGVPVFELDGSIDDPTARPGEVRAWMLETLPRFREVFNPRLERILAELGAE